MCRAHNGMRKSFKCVVWCDKVRFYVGRSLSWVAMSAAESRQQCPGGRWTHHSTTPSTSPPLASSNSWSTCWTLSTFMLALWDTMTVFRTVSSKTEDSCSCRMKTKGRCGRVRVVQWGQSAECWDWSAAPHRPDCSPWPLQALHWSPDMACQATCRLDTSDLCLRRHWPSDTRACCKILWERVRTVSGLRGRRTIWTRPRTQSTVCPSPHNCWKEINPNIWLVACLLEMMSTSYLSCQLCQHICKY